MTCQRFANTVVWHWKLLLRRTCPEVADIERYTRAHTIVEMEAVR